MTSDLKSKTAQLRKEHILNAAIIVFERLGFRGATIKDIAKEAGVSDGTVYNVFENKEALLLGILDPMLEASRPKATKNELPAQMDVTALLTGMITSGWQNQTPEMLAMMRIIWSEALINRSLADKYFTKVLEPALNEPVALFETLVSAGKLAGDATSSDTGKDITMSLRVIVSAFLGLALLKMLGDPVLEQHSDEVPDRLVHILLNGLLPRGNVGDHHVAI